MIAVSQSPALRAAQALGDPGPGARARRGRARSTSAATRGRCSTPSSWPARSPRPAAPAGAGGGRRPPGQPRGARLRHALGRRGGGLPGRRPRAASPASGPRRAPGREVYDVWRLGTEPEAALPARGALRRLRDDDRARRWRASSGATERPTATTRRSARASPTPRPCAALGRPGSSAEQLEGTSFVGEIGNLGAASVGRGAGARARPRRSRASTCWRSATAAGRRSPRTSRSPADRRRVGRGGPARRARRSTCRTYYRWTRGRRPNPTKEATMRVGVLGIGKTPHKIQHGKSLRDLVVESGRAGPGRRGGGAARTSRPSTSATSARSASTTRTRPG